MAWDTLTKSAADKLLAELKKEFTDEQATYFVERCRLSLFDGTCLYCDLEYPRPWPIPPDARLMDGWFETVNPEGETINLVCVACAAVG